MLYVGYMENTNQTPSANPEANQLPEANSLPDGFVDSCSADPKAEEEKPELADYKEEKLVEPDERPELIIDDLQVGKSLAVASENEGNKEKKEVIGSEMAGSSCKEEQSLRKCNYQNFRSFAPSPLLLSGDHQETIIKRANSV